MAVTVLPGPVDYLTEGVLAGAKLAALSADLRQQQIRNQLSKAELELDVKRLALTEALTASEIQSRTAGAELTRAQTSSIMASLLAGQPQAEVEESKARTEATRAQAAESGARARKIGEETQTEDLQQNLMLVQALSSPRTLTPTESRGLAEANAAMLGAPTDENTLRFHQMAIEAQSRGLAERLEVEKLQAQNLALYQGLMAGARTEQVAKTPTEAERTEMNMLEKQYERLLGSQEALDQLELFGAVRDHAFAERASKQRENINRRMAEILERIRDKRRASGEPAPTQYKIGDIAQDRQGNSYRFLGGDPNDRDNWEPVEE